MATSNPSPGVARLRSTHSSHGELYNPPSPNTSTVATFITANEEDGTVDEFQEPESYEDDIASIRTERPLLSESTHDSTPQRTDPSVSLTTAARITEDSQSETLRNRTRNNQEDTVNPVQKGSLTPTPPPPGYQPLDFRPALLGTKATVTLMFLYLLIAGGIAILLRAAGTDREFHVASENLHLFAQYVPGLTATMTMLLFRQTASDAIRMIPYIKMADQKGSINSGASASKTIAGAYFPWRSIGATPPSLLTRCLFPGLYIANFLVSAKSVLIGTQQSGSEWVVFVRPQPAYFLIGGYCVMAVSYLVITLSLWSQSTGLRWDPVSLMDFVSLFAKCNALHCFEQLEFTGRPRRASEILDQDLRLRIGYWKRKFQDISGVTDTKVVYGIGLTDGSPVSITPNNARSQRRVGDRSMEVRASEVHQGTASPVEDSASSISTAHRSNFRTQQDQNLKFTTPIKSSPEYSEWYTNHQEPLCNCARYPRCVHYPYHVSPGLGPIAVLIWMIIVTAALFGCIYALGSGAYQTGFSIPNTWGSFGRRNTTDTLNADNPVLDVHSATFPYAIVFRALPAQLASFFSIGFLSAVDLNMRFMQPFLGMFESPGTAAESIALSYLTASAIEVPLQAFQSDHWKVAWFSLLNTLSPFFPIFVSALFTISTTQSRVNFTFSVSSFVIVMTYVIIYWISLPFAWPRRYRRIPRMPLSLADIMGMCHQSQFIADEMFDIASPKMSRVKQSAIVLLRDYKYLFGWYLGRDGHRHLGFDVAETDEQGPLHNVRWVPPKPSWIRTETGKQSLIDRTFRRHKAKVSTLMDASGYYELERITSQQSVDVTEMGEGNEGLYMHGALATGRELDGSQNP